MRTSISTLCCFFFLLLISCSKEDLKTIYVDAGSVDALEQAIEDAGEDGVVILRAGEHHESEGIEIDCVAKIQGEDGAILIFDTKPTADSLKKEDVREISLDIYNCPGLIIENIEFRVKDEIMGGGSAIFIDNSDDVIVRNCKFFNHQYTITVQESDRVKIEDNIIESSELWKNPAIKGFKCKGVLVINGEEAELRRNTISKGLVGAHLSDINGIFEDNNSSFNHIGILPCSVPDSSGLSPRMASLGAEVPSEDWIIQNNTFEHNAWFGILIYDGAKRCTLINNNVNNSGAGLPREAWPGVTGADIEIGTVSEAFGFVAPKTEGNYIEVGAYPNVRIKDCGEGSTIVGGGIILDPAVNPCL